VKVVVARCFDVAPVAVRTCAPAGPGFTVGIVGEQLMSPEAVAVTLQSDSLDGVARLVVHVTDTFSFGAKCEPETVTPVPAGPVFGATVTDGKSVNVAVAVRAEL
jgi:hypothetical protein